ncbi:MAG TPA: glycerophosphodiester phosphodiesterase [Tepidisphaeraceae bacterium]|jgi:glycerophosphoryl diester phosphodiesterase|nr:glycerophosphodiester phosphodiesterase [Tepidisphaeraceae bacterium]
MPIIVAHRGLHVDLPENSLPAMLAAWDAGITWCECDVHLSADGIPIVIHDETLDRTTTGHGRVADFTASDLKKLKLLGPGGNPTAHTIPLLDDLLEPCGANRRLLVETKPLLGERIDPIAKKVSEMQGMLHSFHIDDMRRAGRITSNRCPVALLAEDARDLPADFPGSFHLNHQSLTQCPRVKIGVWTVNDLQQIRRMIEIGVEMIITDVPLEAQRLARSVEASAPSPALPASQKSAD